MTIKDRLSVGNLVMWFFLLVVLPMITEYRQPVLGMLTTFLFGMSVWMAFLLGFCQGRAVGEMNDEKTQLNGEEK